MGGVLMIGDLDPEDGYDAGDPIRERIATLIEIVEGIREELDSARRARRRLDAIRVVDAFADELTVTGAHLRQLRDELEAIT